MRFSPVSQSLEFDKYDPSVPDLHCGSFDSDENYRIIRRRGASSWLLTLTTGGAGYHRTSKQEHRSLAGIVTLWEPRVYQEYGTLPGAGHWAFHWVHFVPHPHWRMLLDWGVADEGFRSLAVDSDDPVWPVILNHFEKIQTLLDRASFLDRVEAHAHLELLCVELRRRTPMQGSGDSRLDDAIAFGLRHLGEAFGVRDLAERAGLSPSRFAELFLAATGLPPRAYFEQERISRARQMLALTNMPIKLVALELGFRSEFYFSNRFRLLTGHSPSEYRRLQEVATSETG
ncbi:MAG: helix-turn-helix domain-containing protein [Fimbriimonas sp.]